MEDNKNVKHDINEQSYYVKNIRQGKFLKNSGIVY